MSLTVTIERHFPPNFFPGTNRNDKTESSSEKLAKASLILAFGYDESNIIRGIPQNNEPDFVTNDNVGFEITFADNREGKENGNIIRLVNGHYEIRGVEDDIIKSITESIKDKALKKQKGAYSKTSKVSVFVISVEPLLYWYGDLHGFNYPHTQEKRDEFFLRLNQEYIESLVFDNIFIMQLTEYQSFILFDIKGFASNSEECITEIKSRKPTSLPNCIITNIKKIEDGSSKIRYEYKDVHFKYK